MTMTAAGRAIRKFALNLSFIRHPCVRVATTVVSEINERLSPNKAPPTIEATIRGREIPVCWASPVATGTKATMVPTEVPTDRETRQEAMNIPASNIFPGISDRVSPTVASTAPISLAADANEPANTNIHIIRSRLESPAFLEKRAIRS